MQKEHMNFARVTQVTVHKVDLNCTDADAMLVSEYLEQYTNSSLIKGYAYDISSMYFYSLILLKLWYIAYLFNNYLL